MIDRLLQDLLIQRQIRHRVLEPTVLLFQILQPLHRIGLHPPVLALPAVIGHLANLQTLADLGTIYLLMLGAVAILVMLLAPKGIWGLIVENFGWQVFPLERSVILGDRRAVVAQQD